MFARISWSQLRKRCSIKSWPRILFCDVPVRKYLSSQAEQSDLRSMLSHRIDNYGGLHFETGSATSLSTLSPAHFEKLVQKQLESCHLDEVEIRSFWFRIASEHANLIESLVKLGFEFHHTKPNCVVLVKPLTKSSNIPRYAYTNIGVGALVVDDDNQVIVVKEKHFYVKQMWKLPGGYLEQGEELAQGVEREVREETGVEAKFECLLLMRHVHRFAFDCSDMYFVSLLRPTNSSRTIRNCDQEIAQCQWAPIEAIREKMSPFNRLAVDTFFKYKDSPLSIRPQTLEPYFASMPPYSVYSLEERGVTK